MWKFQGYRSGTFWETVNTKTSTDIHTDIQETVDRRSSDMMKIEISEMESDYALLLHRYYYFGHSGDVPAMKDQLLYQIRKGSWCVWHGHIDKNVIENWFSLYGSDIWNSMRLSQELTTRDNYKTENGIIVNFNVMHLGND